MQRIYRCVDPITIPEKLSSSKFQGCIYIILQQNLKFLSLIIFELLKKILADFFSQGSHFNTEFTWYADPVQRIVCVADPVQRIVQQIQFRGQCVQQTQFRGLCSRQGSLFRGQCSRPSLEDSVADPVQRIVQQTQFRGQCSRPSLEDSVADPV